MSEFSPRRHSHPSVSFAGAADALARDGFAFCRAESMWDAFAAAGLRDWEGFAASWDKLGPDRYMADGGRYRKRRFATFAVGPLTIERKPHQPHYQSRDYNALNGGVERWFEPVTDAIARHSGTQAIVRTCERLFSGLTAADRRPRIWHVELHQFRIEARADMEGRPTPEGMHHDGVDWVLVMLIRRQNVTSGVTGIGGLDGASLGSFTLAEPMDCAFVDDHRVKHGVTPVRPLAAGEPAWRDVLVLTFRHE